MTLRDRIQAVFVEHGTPYEDLGSESPAADLIDDVVEVVGRWLECPDNGATVYRALATGGPPMQGVLDALAHRARFGSSDVRHRPVDLRGDRAVDLRDAGPDDPT